MGWGRKGRSESECERGSGREMQCRQSLQSISRAAAIAVVRVPERDAMAGGFRGILNCKGCAGRRRKLCDMSTADHIPVALFKAQGTDSFLHNGGLSDSCAD
jgi:hypothetical protein